MTEGQPFSEKNKGGEGKETCEAIEGLTVHRFFQIFIKN
jgi:hypothetical protein